MLKSTYVVARPIVMNVLILTSRHLVTSLAILRDAYHGHANVLCPCSMPIDASPHIAYPIGVTEIHLLNISQLFVDVRLFVWLALCEIVAPVLFNATA